MKTFEKKLPGTITVGKLKALLTRILKLDIEIQLSYISQKVSSLPLISFVQLNPNDIGRGQGHTTSKNVRTFTFVLLTFKGTDPAPR